MVKMVENDIYLGNCVEKLKEIGDCSVDMVYMDPPFFTQKKHSLAVRGESNIYEFDDKWDSLDEYIHIIEGSLKECNRILKNTGSIFVHCDRTASHHIRLSLDKIFDSKNFRSEIIWSYKRWSNSKKGLLNSHQSIYFYSKSSNFKFNTIYKDYSSTTNIDQILQERGRDASGKSVYKKDENGNIVLGKEKKGVPLSDIWEIPYLNPKAKERYGYPTQKPIALLKQIIEISTNEEDLIIDPFCGSGTTCVAAKILNRKFIGIDISKAAVELAKIRLNEMIVSDSKLLENGGDNYSIKTDKELALLKSINAIPVQRNSGIDGFLKDYYLERPVPIKIQGDKDSLTSTIEKLEKSTEGKDYNLKIVLQTKSDIPTDKPFELKNNIRIIKTADLLINESQKQI